MEEEIDNSYWFPDHTTLPSAHAQNLLSDESATNSSSGGTAANSTLSPSSAPASAEPASACDPPVINDPKLVRGATSSGHTFVPPAWDNAGALNQNFKENKLTSRRENALSQKSLLNHYETIIQENGVHHLSDLKGCTQLQKGDHLEPLIK